MPASDRTPGPRPPRDRRGSALLLVLVMTIALAALALSAIYLGSGATLIGKAFDREKEYRYAAEAALAMGRSRLTQDAGLILDDSLPFQLLDDASITGADGDPLPGVKLSSWLARTGSKTGQHGLYASVIAVARDSMPGGGAKFVRRLELMEENFARFLDWSDRLARPGCYGPGEIMDGPVWSNVSICDYGARFRDTVATAGTVSPASGIYEKGRLTGQRPMALPSLARLARLEGYAASGNYVITAPNGGVPAAARLRLEFVWWDLNGDGTAAGDANEPEGFFRVYRENGGNPAHTRADFPGPTFRVADNQCGDWHWHDGQVRFYPVSVHNTAWFRTQMSTPMSIDSNRVRIGYSWTTAGDVDNHANPLHVLGTRTAILRGSRMPGAKSAGPLTPRCYPLGDPHLAATERTAAGGWSAADREVGGTANTFTPATTGTASGEWVPWTGPAVDWSPYVNPPPANMRAFLWPLDRGLNPGTKGVIYVDGTVAMHGVLRGRVTVYSDANVTFVDDLTYAVDPFSDACRDMLGVIAQGQITIADNGINTPQDPNLGGLASRNTWLDDDMHFTLHGVLMALDTFVPENWNQGPGNMSVCNGVNIGRGCIYQVGGAIVRNREVTYTMPSYNGYMESRTYDTRMTRDSPPYFPTTGRYFDNRFYEVDPQGFDLVAYLRRIGQTGS